MAFVDPAALEGLVTGESQDQNSSLAILGQIQNLHRQTSTRFLKLCPACDQLTRLCRFRRH